MTKSETETPDGRPVGIFTSAFDAHLRQLPKPIVR